ncbi:MAG: hypothetical protein ACLFUN_07855, partial [Desulfobacterales bacterium]
FRFYNDYIFRYTSTLIYAGHIVSSRIVVFAQTGNKILKFSGTWPVAEKTERVGLVFAGISMINGQVRS